MKQNSALIFTMMIATALSSCASEKRGRVPVAQADAPTSPAAPAAPEKTVAQPEKTVVETSILQITVLNFLNGGREQCKVTAKIFSFSHQDENVKTTLCKNSMTEVIAVSDAGTVRFSAVDLVSDRELPTSGNAYDQFYELGKERSMLRYYPENPHGFTLVMAEDVTGVDPELLAAWNRLNSRSSKLREEILLAEKRAAKVSRAVLDELNSVETEMAELAKKMKEARRS